MDNKIIKIKLIKGTSKLTRIQKATIIGLGLRGIGSESSLKNNASTNGMIRKVNNMVEIINID